MSDKDNKKRLFEKNFLLADIKPNVVLKMPFLTISNPDIDFQARDLQWRPYITGNIFLTTRKVELIGKKEFAAAVFDLEYKAFVIYVTALGVDLDGKIYPWNKA